jgi:hypothetical protein
MSSLESYDPSCIDVSDAMSCTAMIELSKKQAHESKLRCAYSIDSPLGDKVNSISDKGVEFVLQANGIVSKNICFNPTIMRKNGSWENQFQLLNTDTNQNIYKYDILTRPR